MAWENRQLEVVEACQPSLEERMKRCHQSLKVTNDLVDAMDAIMKLHGQYALWEKDGHRLYAVSCVEQKQLKAEWKALEKEAKKAKRK